MIYFKAPDFEWELDDTDGVREIDKITMTFTKNEQPYTFTYDYKNTVRIYAGVEIIAFVAIVVLLIAFVLLVNADVVKFVIAPLEKMYEKVI